MAVAPRAIRLKVLVFQEARGRVVGTWPRRKRKQASSRGGGGGPCALIFLTLPGAWESALRWCRFELPTPLSLGDAGAVVMAPSFSRLGARRAVRGVRSTYIRGSGELDGEWESGLGEQGTRKHGLWTRDALRRTGEGRR